MHPVFIFKLLFYKQNNFNSALQTDDIHLSHTVETTTSTDTPSAIEKAQSI